MASTNDPNNLDDETYILRLIKQVITVSLETGRNRQQPPTPGHHPTKLTHSN